MQLLSSRTSLHRSRSRKLQAAPSAWNLGAFSTSSVFDVLLVSNDFDTPKIVVGAGVFSVSNLKVLSKTCYGLRLKVSG